MGRRGSAHGRLGYYTRYAWRAVVPRRPGPLIFGVAVADLEHAAELGANQVTTYPLFTFPYTSAGEYLHLKGVKLPDLAACCRQNHAITEWAERSGFQRVSVWGLERGEAPRYSSVTRDGYIGIGPGSGSHLSDGFTLNTFDLPEWERSLAEGRSPIALRMPFEGEMSGWWWLYWRFYDTDPHAFARRGTWRRCRKGPALVVRREARGARAPAQRHARTNRHQHVLAASCAEPLRAGLREHAVDRRAS